MLAVMGLTSETTGVVEAVVQAVLELLLQQAVMAVREFTHQ
jgi:hypothetical protein